MNNGGGKFRRFALFPLMLLMLLLLPTRMVAQTAYAYAEFEKSTGTLTFKCGPKPAGAYDLNEGEKLPGWYAQRDKIKTVVFDASFANARPTSCCYWFCFCSNLTTIEGIEYLNTEKVTNMKDMFYRCSALTSLNLSNFNTAGVKDMYGMFCVCSALTSLDLSNFNTANVTDMSNMFERCSALTTIFVSDKFVTDHVTNNSNMFSGCNKLIGAIEYAGNNTNNKDYANYETGYFTPEGGFPGYAVFDKGTGTLTFKWNNSTSIPAGAYGLNVGYNDPRWLEITVEIQKVVFDASFANARPTSCYHWFSACENLTTIEGIEYLNTEKVTNMSDMFYHCSTLTSLDLSNFNTAKVTNMEEMFIGCSALTTIYVSDKFVTDHVTNGSNMFSGCNKLIGAIEYDENNSKIDHTYANYTTGYFSKLVGKNGNDKIGATGETLATDNLTLADDKDFVAYEPFAAKAASYSRTMNEGTTWATLCLPFEVSLANQNFRAFKLLSADDVAETVELEEIETNIEAGTPVIIKMNEGANSLSISEENKAIAKDVQTAEAANGNYQLQGLYTQKLFSKDVDNNCYIVKGDKLMNPAKLLDKTTTESVGSKPFRAYMVDNSSAPAAGARMFSISVGGSTTAIEQLETTADSKAEYYDLQGRRLQDLQKGINIVKRGGKTMKVIIK